MVLAALIVAVAAHGYAHGLGRERRMRLAALQATVLLASVLAGTAALRVAFPTQEMEEATLLAYQGALCALAVALLAALVREPWARKGITDLVVDLGEARSETLRDALARALRDPTLEVGYRLGNGYVDVEGRPLALPAPGSQREVLDLLAEGLSNSAIAGRLFVTERTVEAHVKQVFLKLSLDLNPDSHRRVLAVLAYLRGERADSANG